MALTRTKKNKLFHQRYSELSDEIRAKNKREDRLLDTKLKYYEREKNIHLNILRKEQYQFERTHSYIMEQLHKIYQEKQRQSIPYFNRDKIKLESSLLPLSTSELFKINDCRSYSQLIPSISMNQSTNVIRPHSVV